MKDTNLLEILFDHGIDVRDRKIYLHGELNSEEIICSDFIRSLKYLDKTVGPIEIWICTPGGYTMEMFAAYDTIRACKNQVTTVGFGGVQSAGCVLLAAGDIRKATKNCWFMSHDFQWEEEGDSVQHRTSLKAVDRMLIRWCELMSKHSNKTKNWWKKASIDHRELWWNAEQMLKNGIIDEILEVE